MMEHGVQKRQPDKTPMGNGAGLGEYIAPTGRPDKIPNGDWGGFGDEFCNRVWGWGEPPRPKPAPLPFLHISIPIRNNDSYRCTV